MTSIWGKGRSLQVPNQVNKGVIKCHHNQKLPYNHGGVHPVTFLTATIHNKLFALGVKLTGNKRTWNFANYKHVETDIDIHHVQCVVILLVQQLTLQAHSPNFLVTGVRWDSDLESLWDREEKTTNPVRLLRVRRAKYWHCFAGIPCWVCPATRTEQQALQLL
ncbi:hypothetical protein TNCV_2655851 [Trichonephila clavipes]|nr:hypothetical protein TNCV_2655851 [Trichonephila clavipes]